MRSGILFCPVCKIHGVSGIEMDDYLCFNIDCSQGHKSAIVYEAERFEILFDRGISAILDDYSREAISTLAASQERFHEFFIKVLLAHHKIELDQTAAIWKLMSSQSERQLGAFYYSYIAYFGQAPKSDKRRIELRNDVTHKGKIPSIGESIDYAKFVYEYILTILNLIKPTLNDEISEVCKNNIHHILEKTDKTRIKKLIAAPTAFWLLGPEERFGQNSFEEVFKKRKDDFKNELEERLNYWEQESEDY